MARILRARSVTSPRTPKKTGTVGQDAIEKSFHDPSVLVGKTTKKRKLRTLMARSPITDPLSRPVVEQFTNNPNVKYDNSKAPGAVTIKKVARPQVGTGRQGHGKAIKPGRFSVFGGKRLKRF